MKSIKITAFAVAGLVAVPMLPAAAADLYEEPVYKDFVPVEPVAFGGWYLRGHIGMSNQRYKGLDYEYFGAGSPGYTQTWLDEGGFDSGAIYGVGVGYAFNDWLRTDVTAEYRGKTGFRALDRVVNNPGTPDFFGINDYSATKSELLLLANAYADLGNYWGFSPYIGAGIGASRNTISHFNDVNVPRLGGGYADKDSKWDLAWALHAGVGYQINDRVTLDLGYSYTHLGDATTAPVQNYDPAFTRSNDGMKFRDISSHDLKLGFRYAFN